MDFNCLGRKEAAGCQLGMETALGVGLRVDSWLSGPPSLAGGRLSSAYQETGGSSLPSQPPPLVGRSCVHSFVLHYSIPPPTFHSVFIINLLAQNMTSFTLNKFLAQ